MKNSLHILLKEFKPEQVFNANKTGFFFNCLPDRTLVFRSETSAGGKLSREIVTGCQYGGREVAPSRLGKPAK